MSPEVNVQTRLLCIPSEAVKKLKIKEKRPNPTRVGRLENFRAQPYEEKP